MCVFSNQHPVSSIQDPVTHLLPLDQSVGPVIDADLDGQLKSFIEINDYFMGVKTMILWENTMNTPYLPPIDPGFPPRLNHTQTRLFEPLVIAFDYAHYLSVRVSTHPLDVKDIYSPQRRREQK